MKKIIFILFITHLNLFYSQISLNEMDLDPNFDEFPWLSQGDIKFIDIENDGDDDLVISGKNKSNIGITDLYINDGLGNFTKINDSFLGGLFNSQIEIGDLNNDNYDDIIIDGTFINNIYQRELRVYINNGNSTFSIDSNNLFTTSNSDYEFKIVDTDNDGDNDIIISHLSLLLNDGSGNLTQQYSSPQLLGNISVSDVDNNGYIDYFTSGETSSRGKLFYNNGITSFSINDSTFENSKYSSAEFIDIDNDGFDDLIVSGEIGYPPTPSTLFYKNNSGAFTQDSSILFERMRKGEIKKIDFNNDGFMDVIFSGEIVYLDSIIGYVTEKQTHAYENLNGSFQLNRNYSFSSESAYGSGAIEVSDIDNDGDKDLIILNEENGRISLFINDNGFKIRNPNTLPYTKNLYVIHDMNNDNFPDVLILSTEEVPFHNRNNVITKSYLHLTTHYNNGNGFFNLISDTIIDSNAYAYKLIEKIDINNDGLVDFILPKADTSLLLINSLTQKFEKKYIPTDLAFFSDIVVGDINNDSLDDFIISGKDNFSSPFQIYSYINQGNSNFNKYDSTVVSTNANQVFINLTQHNSDSYKDIITNIVTSSYSVLHVFTNDSSGSFPYIPYNVKNYSSSFYAKPHVFDANLDAKDDILCFNEVYIKTDSGYLAKEIDSSTSSPLSNSDRPIYYSGDLNGDIYPEIIVSFSAPVLDTSYSIIFQNKGYRNKYINSETNYFSVDSVGFNNLFLYQNFGSNNNNVIHDLNNDGKNDIIMIGAFEYFSNNQIDYHTKIYLNNTCNFTIPMNKYSDIGSCGEYISEHTGKIFNHSNTLEVFDTIPTYPGCYKNDRLRVTIYPEPIVNVDTIICESNSLTVNGNVYSTTGIYYDTLQTTKGCDSIVITNLTVDTINNNYSIKHEACGNDAKIIASTIKGISPFIYSWSNNIYTDSNVNISAGTYSLTTEDSAGCSKTDVIQIVNLNDTNVFLTNIGFYDKLSVIGTPFSGYFPNLPNTMNNNSSNPLNLINPGEHVRFKIECQNNQISNQSIIGGSCKLRTNDPYLTITDSTATLNNVAWGQKEWSVDEFEVYIDPSTPPGYEALVEFIVIEGNNEWRTTCIPIPITPCTINTPACLIDDDNIPDSQGDDDDLAETNETIEFLPFIDNVSGLNAELVLGTFMNLNGYPLINIWDNQIGANGLVSNSSWFNYSSNQPQPITFGTTNAQPQFDFVFDYNFVGTKQFDLQLVLGGGFKLFGSVDTALIKWSNDFRFNSGYPVAQTCTGFNLNLTVNHQTSSGANNASITANASNGTPPYSYSWSNGDSVAHIDSLAAGIYVVTATDSYGCTKTETVTIGVSSINKYEKQNTLVLYPNPANNDITIESVFDIHSLSVYNTLGQKVNTSFDIKSINNKKFIINISRYSNGTYIVRTDKGNTIRFIKH